MRSKGEAGERERRTTEGLEEEGEGIERYSRRICMNKRSMTRTDGGR